ncbi:hypothetical protein Avbf_18233, partial [Armadillidium vulgare]
MSRRKSNQYNHNHMDSTLKTANALNSSMVVVLEMQTILKPLRNATQNVEKSFSLS